MNRYRKLAVLFLLAFVAVFLFVNAGVVLADPGNSNGAGSSAVVEPKGLPVVTEDSFAGKVNGVANKIHRLAIAVVPHISVGVIVAGAILGIILKDAWKIIVRVVLAIIAVIWAPYIIALVISIFS